MTRARQLLALVFVVFAATSVFAQTGAKIEFPETVYAFGTVAQGTIVKHDFAFENKGSTALHVTKVVASCGCTASTTNKNDLQPAEKGIVTVSFDSSNFFGDITKSVTVYSSDPEHPTMGLLIKGRIEPEIELNPDKIVLGEITKGNPATAKVNVRVKDVSKATIKDAKSFSEVLTVSSDSQDSKSRDFIVMLSPNVPVGEFRGRVIVAFDEPDGKTRTVNVPVYASVKSALRINPTLISFGILEGKEDLLRTAKLEYAGEGELKIRSVESSDSAVKAVFQELKKGKVFTVSIKVNPSALTRDLKAEVGINTIQPDGKEDRASISVYGVIPMK